MKIGFAGLLFGGDSHIKMEYVYILRSKKDGTKIYIGITNNLKRRLREHSVSSSNHYTYRFAPGELETYLVFQNKRLVKEFEAYLKTHSGRAFLRRRLITES